MKTNSTFAPCCIRSLALVSFLLLMSTCAKDDLERSIFIRDPEYPELPAYSEWGLNTFGAFIDRIPFISNEIETPAKVSSYPEKTAFQFSGQKGINYVSYSPGYPAFFIKFILPLEKPATYYDLTALHNSSWDLTDPDVVVTMAEEGAPDTLEILNGTLHFVRAQRLLVDQVPTQAILSGVFEFNANHDGSPLSVSNGRFDVGVSDHNFFNY